MDCMLPLLSLVRGITTSSQEQILVHGIVSGDFDIMVISDGGKSDKINCSC